MAVTEEQIGADVCATVAAVAGVRSCDYPPPQQAPPQGPACWVDLGPIALDMGNIEIDAITVTITVAVPDQGDYQNEYRLVLATARLIVIAFRQNIQVASEAILTAGAVIAKPTNGTYAGSAVVFTSVQFVLETEVETVNLLAL